MTGTAAAGVGLSAYQVIKGAQDAKSARRAIKNYQRQDISNSANAYQNLTPSMYAALMQKENATRLGSTQVDALRQGGLRGVIGGLPQIAQQNNAMTQQIGANIDEQQRQIDQMIAGENVNLRNMREAREIQDLQALGAQYNSANQNMWGGLGQLTQMGGFIGQNKGDIKGELNSLKGLFTKTS